LIIKKYQPTYNTKVKQKKMNKIKLSTNFTVFLLFFGVAALEAFQTSNWPIVLFWLAVGLVFLIADNLKKAK